MTSIASTTDTNSSNDVRWPIAPIAVATVLGTTAFTALGVYGDGSQKSAEGNLGSFLTILAVTLVAAAIVFGLVVPHMAGSRHAAACGLVLSILALLLVVAFWSGLTPTLAVGGILLGATARRTGRRPATGGIAMAVGALALVGYSAIYVIDWMSTNNLVGM